MKPATYDSLGPPGKHIDASIPVRRWDLGLAYGLLGGATGFLPVARYGLGWPDTFRALALDPAFYSRLDNPHWMADWSTLAVATIVGLAMGGGAAWLGLIPRSNQWVVSGPRLLEGKDAIRAARRRSPSKRVRKTDRFAMALHPDLWLAKKILSRHILMYGSVGSGKTQILLGLLQQVFAHEEAKALIYDVKGDMTSKFPQAQASICSPFDARSRVWWVARDVRTATQAAAFADSLIPEDSGSGKFWTQAARQILLGVVLSLQNEKPQRWTWSDLAQRVSLRARELAPVLDRNYRKAYGLISNPDSQTSFNVLATLQGFTRVIDDLARAWPDYNVGKNLTADTPWPGEKGEAKWNAKWLRGRRLFSLTDWAMDDYQGPKKVILQSGPDSGLTAAYIAAMVNVAVPAIISPQLPDNENGRFLGFFLDELASIGKINIAPLIDKGRSKGCVCVLTTQDLSQLRMPQLYGEHMVKALQGMVGTHIVCQIQMGETREELSKLMGSNNVARMDHSRDARLSNEAKPVVYPSQLTDMLGFRKTPKKDPGFVIRAIVQQGDDLLLLDFPGQPMPDLRPGQVPAMWTRRAAGYEQDRDDEPMVAGWAGKAIGEAFTEREIDAFFQSKTIEI
ncbi:type IV secretion system DNA-binding domain-containing protein [Stenotrophomonas sp. GD03937]|uniref:type IV secretion system DNA-binding domain-containing protein n=1 Tax=Stenotrophomonas sp. GD03937 TaxID=2975408 RepID=UPI00244CF8AA|nr:type IV secretion system DNA-binding domain-containing protein [Stenotrophomonas sp. GD03937]MDH1274100.1 type IV secretion system DNA-binding domain-containing protein [Stenotrophomonas sp. GD03937]